MPAQLPEPPDTTGLEPSAMTAAELREAAEKLWAWLEKAQAVLDVSDVDEAAIDEVTDAFNSITRERRRRHREEFPMRGS